MSNTSVPEIPYQFADPCPTSMRDVNITDLSSVNINWKMLTLARPKTKTDEEIFSKYVHIYYLFYKIDQKNYNNHKYCLVLHILYIAAKLRIYKMHKIRDIMMSIFFI